MFITAKCSIARWNRRPGGVTPTGSLRFGACVRQSPDVGGGDNNNRGHRGKRVRSFVAAGPDTLQTRQCCPSLWPGKSSRTPAGVSAHLMKARDLPCLLVLTYNDSTLPKLNHRRRMSSSDETGTDFYCRPALNGSGSVFLPINPGEKGPSGNEQTRPVRKGAWPDGWWRRSTK